MEPDNSKYRWHKSFRFRRKASCKMLGVWVILPGMLLLGEHCESDPFRMERGFASCWRVLGRGCCLGSRPGMWRLPEVSWATINDLSRWFPAWRRAGSVNIGQ